MRILLKLFIFLTVLAPLCVSANTVNLKDIFEEKGMDYILENHESISKKIDEKDKFDLANILIKHYKGPDAITLLTSLAKKDHIRATALLMEKYSQGVNGISSDEKKTKIYVEKLESLYKKASDNDKKEIEYLFCHIYSGKESILKNETKEREYCSKVFEDPKSVGLYAIKLLESSSSFFNPKKGVELFEKCIQDGGYRGWACKVNYAYAGLDSPEIAMRTSAKQLFEYASDDKSVANAVNNLGLFYERGIGTNADRKKAIEQFNKASNYGSGYGIYNLIFYSFFYPGEFEFTAKNYDEAKEYLMFYDYWTEQSGRFDVLPYKEWLSEKKRMPTSQSEFVDYLKEKSENGDARSSCLLGDHFRNINQFDEALAFTSNGKKSPDTRVRKWCDDVDRSVKVMKIYSN
jgi:TPR repeat protein